jgi:signal recognition particle receptor subunit beta
VVFFNYTTMQMTAKIVYYGPGLCGKTTNLQFIHHKTAPQSRGEMISLETETDRTLFFDLLPIDVGVIGGMKVRLQLYTVPGQVFYNATRKLVLKGVDGIVFVADSQLAALDANVESFRNLEENLAELNLNLDQVPFVFQYNKRDIRNIHPVEKLNDSLNVKAYPTFEAAALHGVGVFETLKGISRLAIHSVRHKLAASGPGPRMPGASGSVSVAVPGPIASFDDPLAHLAADLAPAPAQAPAPAEEVKVEFAEEDTGKHDVRVVPTKESLDIQAELERLREMTSASTRHVTAVKSAAAVDRRLQDLLLSDRDARHELKRKSSIEVPAALLKGASALRLHLVIEKDGDEETVQDVAAFRLVGNKRLQSLLLRLDLEVKGK